MDIVLNTRFNNPALPKVPLPGFYDDFGPAGGPPSASTLGTTSRENRPWEHNGTAWARTSDQTAMSPSGTRAMTFVNGYRANGTLTSTLHTLMAGGQYGLVFRYADAANYNYFAYNTAQGYFFLSVSVNDSRQILGGVYTPDAPPAPGDTLSIYMNGPLIHAFHNDQEAIVISTEANQAATRHGLFVNAAQGHQFDDIEFVPA